MSSANFTIVLEEWMGVQSCVNKVKRAGLRTQPCSAPVFMMRVDEVPYMHIPPPLLLPESAVLSVNGAAL